MNKVEFISEANTVSLIAISKFTISIVASFFMYVFIYVCMYVK